MPERSRASGRSQLWWGHRIPAYTCKDCGEGIVSGDEFAEIDGDYYHVECLENMTTRELLALLDVYTETAEMEGDGW